MIDGVIDDVLMCQGEVTSSLNCAQELNLDTYVSFCFNAEETILNPVYAEIGSFGDDYPTVFIYHVFDDPDTPGYTQFAFDLQTFQDDFNVGEYSVLTGDSLGVNVVYTDATAVNDWNETGFWVSSGFNALEGQTISQNNLDMTITAFSQDPVAIEGSVACFVL